MFELKVLWLPVRPLVSLWVLPLLSKIALTQGDSAPIRQAARRTAMHKRQTVRDVVTTMLEAGTIVSSLSPCSSSVVLITKTDGSVRLCRDYRRLNEVTRKDVYPLPRSDEALDSLAGASCFSTLDLARGYCLVSLL